MLLFCSYHLEILNNFEQRAPRFHWALYPTNYVTSFVAETGTNRGKSLALHYIAIKQKSEDSNLVCDADSCCLNSCACLICLQFSR